jgi:hypothetical protein
VFVWASIVVILSVYSVLDVLRSPSPYVRNLPKWLWLAVALLIPVLGPISWLIFGRPPSSAFGGSGVIGLRGRRAPAAPDDDSKFLRQLDDEAFKARMRERRGGGKPGTDPAPEATGGEPGSV